MSDEKKKSYSLAEFDAMVMSLLEQGVSLDGETLTGEQVELLANAPKEGKVN
jgi:hypothetical protein